MVEDSLPNGFNRDFNKLQRLSARNMPTAGDINKQIADAKRMANILSNPESARNYFNGGLKNIEQMKKSAKRSGSKGYPTYNKNFVDNMLKSAKRSGSKGYPTYNKNFVDNMLKSAKRSGSKGYPTYNKRAVDGLLKRASHMNHETIGDILGADWKNKVKAVGDPKFSTDKLTDNLAKMQKANAETYFYSKNFTNDFTAELDRLNNLKKKHNIQLAPKDNTDIDNESMDIISEYSTAPINEKDVTDKEIADFVKSNDDSKPFNERIKSWDKIATDKNNKAHLVARTVLRVVFVQVLLPLLIAWATPFVVGKLDEAVYYGVLNAGWMSPKAYIDVSEANIRIGRSNSAKIMVKLPAQTEVKVIKHIGRWSQVKIPYGYNDESGWIQTQYLNIND
ncbi:SH3 domain-containing protein [Lactiplantibacillus sp. DA1]|uniref:SH3 domain-containing protein n=1 Tax=Lactiplantibacillus sp. DA1 TaxID=3079857 RepID=UPI00292A609F|nr:SH3 domain-containing protein [Lactiplantibacillus sp. DA1]MDV0429749.1 SH3 domain-containing protein [Lactiplantibacillus sp. DA1]